MKPDINSELYHFRYDTSTKSMKRCKVVKWALTQYGNDKYTLKVYNPPCSTQKIKYVDSSKLERYVNGIIWSTNPDKDNAFRIMKETLIYKYNQKEKELNALAETMRNVGIDITN